MNILVIGNDSSLDECKTKFGSSHSYQMVSGHQAAEKFFGSSDIIFDFIIDRHPEQMEVYRDHPKVVAFLNTPKTSLLNLVVGFQGQISCTLLGFNGLPTFLNREFLETTIWRDQDRENLQSVCEQLQTKHLLVDDRVGMVTPRVIFMIINEAYYTFHEGTASRQDIDLGMKLGTNYPFGPFEWSERIGLNNVYELLSAVYQDTKDERYKICPLLKKEYLSLKIK
ncbi:MAG: 3-hydroxyacyl-CoA dehydrogenase family protein [Cyclobacteriaceae bacterium]